MNDDFATLFALQQHSAGEVAGHGSTAISRKIREQLAKLAAGQCNNEERADLISLLRQQPDLIAAFANEIKTLREWPK
jgi:hypothetical protein